MPGKVQLLFSRASIHHQIPKMDMATIVTASMMYPAWFLVSDCDNLPHISGCLLTMYMSNTLCSSHVSQDKKPMYAYTVLSHS